VKETRNNITVGACEERGKESKEQNKHPQNEKERGVWGGEQDSVSGDDKIGGGSRGLGLRRGKG